MHVENAPTSSTFSHVKKSTILRTKAHSRTWQRCKLTDKEKEREERGKEIERKNVYSEWLQGLRKLASREKLWDHTSPASTSMALSTVWHFLQAGRPPLPGTQPTGSPCPWNQASRTGRTTQFRNPATQDVIWKHRCRFGRATEIPRGQAHSGSPR